MRPVFGLVAAGSMVLLAGCEGVTDPSKANLFDNLNNLRTGEYNRQIALNDTTIADLKSSNAAIQSRINGLNGEISSRKKRISRIRARTTSVQKRAQLDTLEQQYTSFQSDTLGLSDRQIVGQLNRLNSALAGLAA